MPKRTQVFISYSHKDKKWFDELKIHLEPLLQNEKIDVWDDTRIKPGDKWEVEIREALKQAKIAVLMISPHFLASEYIEKVERPALMEAAEKYDLTIIWIPVSSSLYKETDIVDYQAAHNPSNPLDRLSPGALSSAWVNIVTKIAEFQDVNRHNSDYRKKKSLISKLSAKLRFYRVIAVTSVLIIILVLICGIQIIPLLDSKQFSRILEKRSHIVFYNADSYEFVRVLPGRDALRNETDLKKEIGETKQTFDMIAHIPSVIANEYLNVIRKIVTDGNDVRIVVSNYTEENRDNFDLFTKAFRSDLDASRGGAETIYKRLCELREELNSNSDLKGSFKVRVANRFPFYTMWIRDRKEKANTLCHLEFPFHRGKSNWVSLRASTDAPRLVKSMIKEFEVVWKEGKKL